MNQSAGEKSVPLPVRTHHKRLKGKLINQSWVIECNPKAASRYHYNDGHHIHGWQISSFFTLVVYICALMMRRFYVFFLLFFSLFVWPSQAQTFILSGYLQDAESGQPLEHGIVVDLKHHATFEANASGFYMAALPFDSALLMAIVPGHQPQLITLFANTNQSADFRLKPLLVNRISSKTELQYQGFLRRSSGSQHDFQANQIKHIPTPFGEADVTKIIQMMPGVYPTGSGSAIFSVRGSNPDQNLFLVDGLPVYNMNHLFGYFSVLDPIQMSSIRFQKGMFSARYGGRTGSITEINTIEGSKDRVNATAQVSLPYFFVPLVSKIAIDGPISKKTTFTFLGRRTPLDLLFLNAIVGDSNTLGYYYYGVNSQITHQFTPKTKLIVGVSSTKDRFYQSYFQQAIVNGQTQQVKNQEGFNYGQTAYNIRLIHHRNAREWRQFQVGVIRFKSMYGVDYSRKITSSPSQKLETFNIQLGNKNVDIILKMDAERSLLNGKTLVWGTWVNLHGYNSGQLTQTHFKQSIGTSDTTRGQIGFTIAPEFGAYVEQSFELSPRTDLNAGLRLTGLINNGHFFGNPEPRLTLRYLKDSCNTWRFSYSYMAQYMHQANSPIGPIGIYNFPNWLPATESLKPSLTHHLNVGWYRMLQGNLQLSIEGFYKEMHRVLFPSIAYASTTNLDFNWESQFIMGNARSYGFEILLRKEEGLSTGWIGYTLSWNKWQNDQTSLGAYYPSRFDRRHELSLVSNHKINRRGTLHFNAVVGSGNVVSIPSSRYASVTGTPILNYSGINSYRVNSYVRFDAGYVISLTGGIWEEQVFNFSVYNMLNNVNPYTVSFSSKENKLSAKYIPFIPSLTYTIRF